MCAIALFVAAILYYTRALKYRIPLAVAGVAATSLDFTDLRATGPGRLEMLCFGLGSKLLPREPVHRVPDGCGHARRRR